MLPGMNGPEWVLDVWEKRVGHTLNAARRAEFLARWETLRLASWPRELVVTAADNAMAADDTLLLSRWIASARVIANLRRAAQGTSRTAPLPRPKPRRQEPRHPKPLSEAELRRQISGRLHERPDYN